MMFILNIERAAVRNQGLGRFAHGMSIHYIDTAERANSKHMQL